MANNRQPKSKMFFSKTVEAMKSKLSRLSRSLRDYTVKCIVKVKQCLKRYDVEIIVISFILLIITPFVMKFGKTAFSDEVDDWAATATYVGLALSAVSVCFIYMTYRSQTNMSDVLQFESIFFQWLETHNKIRNELIEKIDSFSETRYEYFRSLSCEKLSFDDFRNALDEKDDNVRAIMRYYRSLYSMLKYIHKNEYVETYPKRKKYYDIIQSQMSDSEYMTVFFIAMSDKNLMSDKSKEVLSGTSLIELLDESHIFKNLYYQKDWTNYELLNRFIAENLPNTSGSAHFFIDLNKDKKTDCLQKR